ncbi:MAG TPA: hypothetical protein VFJ97_02350 [Dermatophilaceae bacterium]|nr:hypothetical protein [Dermatophilaceae bacterium]
MLRTRVTLTGVVSALLLTTGLITPAQAAPATRHSGQLAAGYLGRQLLANGGYLAPFGVPDLSNTAYAVLGLSAAGVGRDAAREAIGYLKGQVATGFVGSDGLDDPARLGYAVMAAVATGSHPRRFGGATGPRNLVARLVATMRQTGPDAGLFGTADPKFDGAFRQGVALAALKAAGVPSSRVTPALAWLARQQCGNGLWTAYRPDPGAPCPAADPATFAGPDTNSTGMAAQGLAAYHRLNRPGRLLAALDALQTVDGFPFLAVGGQPADPSSTALSIQAILAAGGNPGSARFTVGGRTAYRALASYQLGCQAPAGDRGALTFPGTDGPNTFATVQGVPALLGQTLPVTRAPSRDALPRLRCDAASSRAGATSASLLAGTPGACVGTSGVTVAVDFTAFGGRVRVRCAPGDPATGIAALKRAGFTPTGTQRYGLAFVCRINNKPTPEQDPCITTPPATAYWAYYHASATATSWTYSTVGPLSYDPLPGSIEAWAFGNSAKPSKTPAQVRNTTR